MTIPPNNLDQLVAWIRTFAATVNSQLFSLKRDFQEIKAFFKEFKRQEKNKDDKK